MHQPYPAFSLECGQTLFRLLRNGEIAAQLALFLKCIWILIGAGLGMTVGEPSDVETLSLGAGEDCDLETAESLRNELIAFRDVGPTFGAAEGEAAIDPFVMLLITKGVELAIKAIEKWLERRKSGS